MGVFRRLRNSDLQLFNCAYCIVPSQTRFHSVSGVVVLNSCYTLIKYQRLRQGLLMESIQYAQLNQV